MYSAQCPGCGATLTTNISGQVWLGCQTCHFYGMVQATPGYTPSAPSANPHTILTLTQPQICPACLRTTLVNQVCTVCGYAHVSATAPTPPSGPPTTPAATTQPATPTSAQMRDEVRELVFVLAGDIAEALRDLPDTDWRLSLAGAYERLQEAHTPLYEALGGRHMGDYAPDTRKVHRAVVATTMRLILLAHAAERVGW